MCGGTLRDRSWLWSAILSLFVLLSAAKPFSKDELKLLQDAGGWQYISMSDPNTGFPTEHKCFDGAPHPEECSGKLVLRPNGSFVQETTIRGQNVRRTGRYNLKDDQITFTDELEHDDGPYTLALDAQAKSLQLAASHLHIGLLLDSEYHRQLREKNGEKEQ